jgi:hypothetical protein
MLAILLLYVALAASTAGGLLFARRASEPVREGGHPARLGVSAVGVLLCVLIATCAALAVTSSDLLGSL